MKNTSPENHSYDSQNSNYTANYYSYPNYYPWTTWPNYLVNPWIQPPIIQPVYVPIQKYINPTPVKSYREPISKQPEAYITINKSRTKMYGLYTYIKHNTDFEIELFNPSTATIGAKFKMNGEYIADNHFVLRPGQRTFLDRYLNENRKFKYVIYDVENTTETKEAIANNGLISVEFYREVSYTYPEPMRITHQDYNNIYKCDGSFGQSSDNTLIINTNGNVGLGCNSPSEKLDIQYEKFRVDSPIPKIGSQSPEFKIDLNSTVNGCNFVQTTTDLKNQPISTNTTTNSDNVVCTTTNRNGYVPGVYGYKTAIHTQDMFKSVCLDSMEETKTDIETGMIAKGSESTTEFDTIDMQFENTPIVQKIFKLLPISQKPVEAKDLLPHCKGCGLIGKHRDKYCPNCGTKY